MATNWAGCARLSIIIIGGDKNLLQLRPTHTGEWVFYQQQSNGPGGWESELDFYYDTTLS